MNLISVLTKVFGSKEDRDAKKLWPFVYQINSQREKCISLSDADLAAKTTEFKSRLAAGETLDAILPEAFAVFREATHRVLGERKTVVDAFTGKEILFMAHFDVQLMGAMVLHNGKIAEMKTGEGKTQVAAMSAYLNALTGKGVHIITVNDYLAKRDSEWMGRIFSFMGLTVGCLDTTEPNTAERRAMYACDITFGTNSEFGFDYLRDNMASNQEQCVQRELNYAIVDEVDNILIDEARTPLIISGPVTKSNQEYEEIKPRVEKVVHAQMVLTQKVISEAEQLLAGDESKHYEAGLKLLIVKRGAPKNKKLQKLVKEGNAGKLMKTVETDYLRERKLHEIDEELFYVLDESGHSAELTEKGRNMIGGSNPDFFVVPDLSEMIGKIDADSSLTIEEKSVKKEECHRAYAERSERIHSVSQLLRAYSLFECDVDYVVQDGAILIVDEFTGRILSGRRYSEGLHQALEAKEGVRVAGENQTLATITYQNFFKMYKKLAGMTGTAITEAAEFHEIYKLDVVTVLTNRPMMRKDFDDQIYKTQREKYNAIVKEIQDRHKTGQPILVGTTSIEKSELLSKLLLRSGVQHQVLNAKQHAKEAAIISQAGRLDAVTIATNMAGRGTDIVLGGNFEVLVNNELLKEGIAVNDLTPEEKRKRYAKLYEELKGEQAKVKELGGLFVVGTERHEARRIDNQLRGRSGRQGDLGASIFFLSLDDDLMRIFGMSRITTMMDRLGAEEGEVISHPLVSGAIGNAQKRVEGRNFDVRKHLKEYDDVMNLQRGEIYGLRQRMVRGDDIKEVILDQIAGYLEDIILKHTGKNNASDMWNLKDLYEDLQAICGIAYRIPDAELDKKNQDMLFDEIWAQIKTRYQEKEQRLSVPIMRQLERGVFLMVIDNLWKDHLYEMDHLKSGVQYRSFGQKNPLFEYQREALEAFQVLRSDISKEVTSYIFRMERVEQRDRMGLDRAKTVHQEFNVFSGPGTAPAQQPDQTGGATQGQMITNRTEPKKPQPVRVADAVGRNDPCPCGSGKKYKKCHGA